jgi:hypothetical protein
MNLHRTWLSAESTGLGLLQVLQSERVIVVECSPVLTAVQHDAPWPQWEDSWPVVI